jgi:hypothetical protein
MSLPLRTPATFALAVAAGAMLSFCSAPVDHTVGLAPSFEVRSFLETPMSTLFPFTQTFISQLRAFASQWVRPRADSLRDLDAATLADIGIDASEIGSIESESRGVAAVTRRRIALGLGPL